MDDETPSRIMINHCCIAKIKLSQLELTMHICICMCICITLGSIALSHYLHSSSIQWKMPGTKHPLVIWHGNQKTNCQINPLLKMVNMPLHYQITKESSAVCCISFTIAACCIPENAWLQRHGHILYGHVARGTKPLDTSMGFFHRSWYAPSTPFFGVSSVWKAMLCGSNRGSTTAGRASLEFTTNDGGTGISHGLRIWISKGAPWLWTTVTTLSWRPKRLPAQ